MTDGAIHNGREHFRRLEEHYDFQCEAGSLGRCVDFESARQCFEHLAAEIERLRAENRQFQAALRAIRDMNFRDDTWLRTVPFEEGDEPAWKCFYTKAAATARAALKGHADG